jgi:hypothetical protein
MSISFIDGHIDGSDTCVICGRDIPEGRQVCVICGYNAEKKKPDLVEVVRCENCVHSRKLAPHCEINSHYLHCGLWRGEETKNVWHKYKKYTADYSIVEPTDYCSYGERKGTE